MSYSRNFGFRGFENIVRAGRARTPAGSTLVIGEPVVLDPDAPGFLKQAGAGAAASQAGGVAVFEHIQMQGVDAALNTTSDLNTIPGGRYAQRVHGAGVKVWFRNTPAKTLYDGRTQAAGALLADAVVVADLKPGDGLTPDGAGKFKAAGTGDGVWLTIEQANPSTGVVEARFTF
jgi:hypothetical protein